MKRTELPTTMRASVLVRAGELTVETRPVPIPSADQVIVRVNAVGICGSDVHYFHEGRIGDFVVEEPLVLGHEAGGTIVAVGADIDDARVGERVSIEPQHPCRVCEFCRSGRYNLCPRIDRSGRAVVAGPSEATSMGNILVQARAHGAVLGSLGDLRRVVRASTELRRYEPVRR